MKKMSIAITILALFVFQIQSVAANNLVVNGSFETSFSTTSGLPTSFGTWNADYATSVETQTGIISLEGSRMLKFINSAGFAASSFGACDVWQLIDVSSYSSLIASGVAVVTASANFNRIAGDQETDTAFKIELYAFSGLPGSFPSQINNNNDIASASKLILTDDDLDTWQKVDVELSLPQSTSFLAIHIAATENVVNDVSGIEFDGHYADNVKVFIQTKTEMPTFFEDNFNDGILDGWTVGTTDVGNVAIESGELSCSGEVANLAWPTALVIDDFTLEYDMKIISASGTTETYFRADNLSATIPNGYMFSVRNSNGIALYKRDNNKWITLETAGFQYTLNNWYHFKILAVEDQLQVYIDGVKKIDVTDTTYSSGNIRLGSWQDPNFGWTNEHVHYDNVRITKYHSLMIVSNYEFSLQENSQETFSLQILNQDGASHLASLEILNPYDDLIATLSQDPVSLAPGESKEIPITIDATSVAAGTYDIQIKVTDDEENISYSNIKIYVTANGEENLPNLNISSPDISFSKLNPEQGETINLSAVIHNQGNSPAADVSVEFYDFGNLLGKVTIESLNANALEIASTSVSFSSAGSHLIRVVVDPSNNILELDESDNEASQILQVGSEPDITGNILVTGGLPSTVVANSLFKVTGHAAYEIYINGDRNTDYDVKGGTVQITIKGDGGREWIYPGIYTDINGNFSKLLQAPEDAGTYQIIMTVTDKTFTGTRNLFFEVIAQSPPTPPSPPTISGSGTWNYDSSGGGWTWEWTQLPVHEPILESNLYVHSEDIYFSKNNPALGDEISIITEIHYWSSSTAITAENVPVNFYVTYPGFPKMKIGETTIQNISVGEPDLGSSHVFVSWKNQAEGIYIVEVEIDPEYIEENQFDNAATRAIIVGQVALGDYGVISGHVTNPWGGVGGVFIDLFDSDGTFLSNTVTDETGGYLFADIPAAGYTVQIIVPDGYSADAETKTTTVSSNAISAVNFKITDIKGPITTDAATDLNPVQIGDTVNLSAFVDDTNTGESDILSAEYSLGGGETWIPMDAVDGDFDSPSEWVGLTFTAPGTPGVYELCVRGADSYKNIGPEECFLLVVYDPEGGFVTGGGWIDSPIRAYIPNQSLTGKATFGFVSKYKKGATVPTGQTEFQFKTADLNFHSDSYEWLVVTGSNYAKFKGKGTINGDYDPNGNLYKFMLWAGDDEPDTFRIKIWLEDEDAAEETVIYDNGFDQAITGGSIVIHTKEK